MFDIHCDNEDSIASAQIEFTYDSTIGLDIDGVALTARTDGFFDPSFTTYDDDPSAVGVKVLLFNLSGMTIAPGSGPILLVEYSLEPDAAGDSPLQLTNVLLSDPIGNPLPVTWQSGEFHVGEFPSGSIQGTVFEDLNRNAWQDEAEGEEGIPGVLVTLSSDISATRVVSTNLNGGYEFAGLTGGETYTVTETDLMGYFSTTPNVVTVTVQEAPASGTVVNFGDRRLYRVLLPIIIKHSTSW
jgi:hypothetical protein